MIRVNMQVAEGMYKFARYEVADVGDDIRQQRITADVERNA